MSKEQVSKKEFYKRLEQEQRLIDVEEDVHKRLENEDTYIPTDNTGLS